MINFPHPGHENKQTTGGIPALRGFRKQFLYTLRRILDSDTETIYPERFEDLDIYDETGRLREVVQVKDHQRPLTFSELETFFQRSIQIVEQHPKVRVVLASYGELGPELKGCIGADESTLKKIAKFTPDLLPVFKQLSFQPLQEKDELQRIENSLKTHPLTIGDWQSAFDLLMQKLYRGAENNKAFTHQTVLKYLQNIGRYLAGLNQGISDNLQTAINSCSILSALHNRVIEKHAKSPANDYLLAAMEQLDEIYTKLIPDELDNGKTNLSLPELKKWQLEVSSIQANCFLIYLFWCGYLISHKLK